MVKRGVKARDLRDVGPATPKCFDQFDLTGQMIRVPRAIFLSSSINSMSMRSGRW